MNDKATIKLLIDLSGTLLDSLHAHDEMLDFTIAMIDNVTHIQGFFNYYLGEETVSAEEIKANLHMRKRAINDTVKHTVKVILEAKLAIGEEDKFE